ncbi:hypothetical protein [Thalassospira marina]|uniref:Uncharacterized protein n=1 Tax=Thalassospira marina TaxID=2048283 RepID=A0ABN5FHQ8_9PROT|nr:hypothetical protein [Thalassospira marina]AUG53948.1 hypothetical protein CSC3H3_15390 [Thalassospira marina]
MISPLNLDLCLIAASEAAMIAALSTTVTNEQTGETQSDSLFHDGQNWIAATHEWQLVPIGRLQITQPEMDEAGNIVTPAQIDNRFHMNVLCNDRIHAIITAFDQAHFDATGEHLLITPNNQLVRWA